MAGERGPPESAIASSWLGWSLCGFRVANNEDIGSARRACQHTVPNCFSRRAQMSWQRAGTWLCECDWLFTKQICNQHRHRGTACGSSLATS